MIKLIKLFMLMIACAGGTLALAIIWQRVKDAVLPKPKPEPAPEFILSASQLWWDWLGDHAEHFGWWAILQDSRYGGYSFRQLTMEATKRSLTRLELERTLNNYSRICGYNIRFYVAVKELQERDVIKIIYTSPETDADYKKMLKRRAEEERRVETNKETMRKPISGGIKSNNQTEHCGANAERGEAKRSSAPSGT